VDGQLSTKADRALWLSTIWQGRPRPARHRSTVATMSTWRPSPRRAAGLQPRWPQRIRQYLADRRRGGRLPRTLRRAAAVVLVLVAGVIAVAPPAASAGEPVLALVRDLPTGAVIEPGDVQIVQAADPPDGVARDPTAVIGRILAGPARRGEIVTDVRLVDPAGPAPGPGRVAVPIRPADPAIVDLLGPGMHVAVVLVGEEGTATLLATDAVVLVITPPSERGDADRPVVLAVPAESADRIVAAALGGNVALRFT
jgi:hypothetical protein